MIGLTTGFTSLLLFNFILGNERSEKLGSPSHGTSIGDFGASVITASLANIVASNSALLRTQSKVKSYCVGRAAFFSTGYLKLKSVEYFQPGTKMIGLLAVIILFNLPADLFGALISSVVDRAQTSSNIPRLK